MGVRVSGLGIKGLDRGEGERGEKWEEEEESEKKIGRKDRRRTRHPPHCKLDGEGERLPTAPHALCF